uniref:Pyrin domain-containing protein n=1 Tax=Acanthochromis polyacanthus TaxID=80966 RepID=A0A3Q1FCS9_9TELE
MASVKEVLFATLEELLPEQLNTFQWYLTSDVLEGFDHIPRGRINGVSRTSTVDLLVDTYGYNGAITITVTVLLKMKLKLRAETLQKKYAEGKTNFF